MEKEPAKEEGVNMLELVDVMHAIRISIPEAYALLKARTEYFEAEEEIDDDFDYETWGDPMCKFIHEKTDIEIPKIVEFELYRSHASHVSLNDYKAQLERTYDVLLQILENHWEEEYSRLYEDLEIHFDYNYIRYTEECVKKNDPDGFRDAVSRYMAVHARLI